MKSRYIAYYRVSDRKQGRSGLGLEAQQAAIGQYLGGKNDAVLLGEFIEVERGWKKNRPQLTAALDACRHQKATLLIAKLDRLARNVAFVASLMEGQTKFVCCDMPDVNEFTIHIFAAVAQWESRQISLRTRDAMAAAKRKGATFGRTGKERARENKEGADAFAHQMAPTIASLQQSGITTTRALAAELNRLGIASARGKRWHGPTVHALINRIKSFKTT